MRTFNPMAMSLSKLFIFHGIHDLVCETEKGSRSTFFPISPCPVFEWTIFSQLPSLGGEGKSLGDISEKVRDRFSDFIV